jgi:hypothetical protein
MTLKRRDNANREGNSVINTHVTRGSLGSMAGYRYNRTPGRTYGFFMSERVAVRWVRSVP